MPQKLEVKEIRMPGRTVPEEKEDGHVAGQNDAGAGSAQGGKQRLDQ